MQRAHRNLANRMFDQLKLLKHHHSLIVEPSLHRNIFCRIQLSQTEAKLCLVVENLESDWTARNFYDLSTVRTFYTMNEADEFSSTYIVNIIFNAFLCYTAIMLNSITIHAIRKTSSLPKPLKTLLLSLAVSDLSVGLLVHPLYIAFLAMGLEQNNEYNATSRNTEIAFFRIANFLCYASFFGVLALTVDRFLAIYLPLRYQEFVTHKRAVAVVILTMVLSSFISSFSWWIPVHDRLIIYTSTEIVCLVIIGILYCKIYLTVRRHRNQFQSLQAQQDEGQNREMMLNIARLVN